MAQRREVAKGGETENDSAIIPHFSLAPARPNERRPENYAENREDESPDDYDR